MHNEKEQLKEAMKIIFMIFIADSHSPMSRLFGCSEIVLYHPLSDDDITELKKMLQDTKQQYKDFRKIIQEYMTKITTSTLLTTEETRKITILFTDFLYKSHRFIQYLVCIAEITLNENLTNYEQKLLKDNLKKAKKEYSEGRKIIYEKIKIIKGIIDPITETNTT